MPSPFPGMDPYLEAPGLFPEVHNRLAAEISATLNRTLPPHYYAWMQMRHELGILEGDDEPRGPIIPDVVVARQPKGKRGPRAAVAEPSRRAIARGVALGWGDDLIRQYWIEIRDPKRDHKLITVIEILSPSNKRPGPDRDAYEAKQREVLASDASLVEIDLLRQGRRIVPTPRLAARLDRIVPRPGYVILVNRSWDRGPEGLGYSAYPVGLRDALPCLPIPLRAGEPEWPLDLQAVFTQVYDTGAYPRGAVDYTSPPTPPLAKADAAWAAALLRESGLIAPAS